MNVAAFPSPSPIVHIALIGPGGVGTAFLNQLEPLTRVSHPDRPDLNLAVVANSRWMWFGSENPRLFDRARGTQVCHHPDPAHLARHLKSLCGPKDIGVVVDCSASEAVVDQYASYLEAGLHVVTANKRGPAGDRTRWNRVRDVARKQGRRVLIETTVGAGLPVIGAVGDMRLTGDPVREISGMLSGSLAWLLNAHQGRVPFSQLVQEAAHMGLTEPDPRDDLSGMDVARKLVILGRTAGLDLDMNHVRVTSLVPPALQNVPLEVFWSRLSEMDADMEFERVDAKGHGVLRHVARLDAANHQWSVGLEVVPFDHPFSHAKLTDNVIRILSDRYANNPMVIQGPGAGVDVTAAGLLADVLRCG
jgi:aspartokinase/homoserine dehydrogenase 1